MELRDPERRRPRERSSDRVGADGEVTEDCSRGLGIARVEYDDTEEYESVTEEAGVVGGAHGIM